jgi:hypothetical protein
MHSGTVGGGHARSIGMRVTAPDIPTDLQWAHLTVLPWLVVAVNFDNGIMWIGTACTATTTASTSWRCNMKSKVEPRRSKMLKTA